MKLENLQNLSTADKLLLLQTTGGLTILEEAATSNSLSSIAKMLKVSTDTLNRWRKYPEIAAILGEPKSRLEPKPDLSRPVAYRILVGYNHNTARQYPHRGCSVHSEYPTALAAWDSGFIANYFRPFNVSKDNYLSDFFQKLSYDGVYHLSNLFSIAYTDVTRTGVIRVIKEA